MNLRRAVQCGAITCMITLAVPSVASARDDRGEGSRTTHCFNHLAGASTDTHPSSSSNNVLLLQQENDHGQDSSDTRSGYGHNNAWWYWYWYWFWLWHRHHCVPDPPADVPEAPQVLMLSGSAALTGGAAMLVIRRRAKNGAPARA